MLKLSSLQVLKPDVAKQWHSTKNGDLTPNDVTLGSNKRVWWQCERNHEWEAVIFTRARGIGCPICNQGKQTSFPEQAIYFYLKNVFSDTLSRYKFDKWEVDIFVPSLNLGIEYDGIYYHKNRKEADRKKEEYITSKGIYLLRVKETEPRESTTKAWRKKAASANHTLRSISVSA